MPKMACRCGQISHYGEIPCPIEWLVISDDEYPKFSGTVNSEDIYREMKSLLRCPKCGRLWVFWDGFDAPPEECLPARELLVEDDSGR